MDFELKTKIYLVFAIASLSIPMVQVLGFWNRACAHAVPCIVAFWGAIQLQNVVVEQDKVAFLLVVEL